MDNANTGGGGNAGNDVDRSGTDKTGQGGAYGGGMGTDVSHDEMGTAESGTSPTDKTGQGGAYGGGMSGEGRTGSGT